MTISVASRVVLYLFRQLASSPSALPPALALFLVLPSFGHAAVVYVGGFNEPTTIPAGFAAASPGDTIIVRDGTYLIADFAWTSTDADIRLRSENGAGACTLRVTANGSRHMTIAAVTGVRIGRMINGAGRGFTFVGGNVTGVGSDGGAIWIQGSTDAEIEDCVFDGNSAEGSGGAVAIRTASSSISWTGAIRRCTFHGNSARFNGGAAYVVPRSGAWTITSSNFEGNMLQYGGDPCYGGALTASATSTNATIEECAFRENAVVDAPSGSCTGFGGAVALYGEYAGKFNQNDLVGNRAVCGGGLYVWMPSAAIPPILLSQCSGNTFRNNEALRDGGGLLTDHAPNYRLPIYDCVFVGNSAGRYGGGAHFWHTSQDMRNCVLVYNHASKGGGLWIDLRGIPTDSEYTNLTLAFNDAEYGAGIAVGRRDAGDSNPVVANVQSCIFALNAGPAYEELTSTNITTSLSCNDAFGNDPDGEGASCENCFSADPEFCGQDLGVFTLLASSPCVNAQDCGLIGAMEVGCNGWVEPEACETTWLEEASPVANHSQSDSLRVGSGAIGLARFSDIVLPTGATFDSAAVRFDLVRAGADASVEARECLRSAIFSQATWLVFRTGQPWAEEGASEEGVDYGTALLGRADRLNENEAVVLGPWLSDIASQGKITIVLRPASTGDGVLWACGSYGPRLRVWYSQ